MFGRIKMGMDLKRLGVLLVRPQMLAFLPALVLAAYWFGGEGVLTLFAMTFPMVLLILGMFERERRNADRDPLTGLATRASMNSELHEMLTNGEKPGAAPIAFALELDDAAQLRDHLGTAGFETVLCRVADRLNDMTRSSDVVARIQDHRFAIGLSPVRGSGRDVAIAMSERLQTAVSEPVSVDSASVYVSLSIGFCMARRAPEQTGRSMLDAAEIAMDEARRAGPASIRAYASTMGETLAARNTITSDLGRALDDGEIRPWFQPQISTETGRVTGFEALARWEHPDRGIVPPGDFLPGLEASGQIERLGEVILFHSLSALRAWDRAGLDVPTIGLNFSGAELRNPRLVDRLAWELDRFDLRPERLSIEILETVVAGPGDDTIVANIAALAKLGCSIDLDDFGTGHASIGNIRRFAVTRIKIDRSFVTRLDRDPAQQKMVTAILSMAEQLDLETLAEGVETVEEHTLLAQLGCGHVQGFGIARPMPFDDTLSWLERHESKLIQTPQIGSSIR